MTCSVLSAFSLLFPQFAISISTYVRCIDIQLALDLQLVECTDAKPADMEGRLYTLCYAILYKGLEHSGFCYQWGVLEPIPRGYRRTSGSAFRQ